MAGMTTTGNTSSSDYNNRSILLEVTGLCGQNIRTSNYTLKVPYSRMAETIKRITKMGGKVSTVNLLPEATQGDLKAD